MDEDEKKVLKAAGWPPELLERLNNTSTRHPTDELFANNSRKALKAAGYGAIEFFGANPGISPAELARRLGKKSNGIGLIIALYDEANEEGLVREIAKDLLARAILDAFPEGWPDQATSSTVVPLSGWEHKLRKYVPDPSIGIFSKSIVKDLVFDHPPEKSWKPQPKSDPLLNELFDRCWPTKSG